MHSGEQVTELPRPQMWQAETFRPTPEDLTRTALVKKDYWFERSTKIGELGEVSMLRHKTNGSRVYQKTYTTQSEEEAEGIVRDIKVHMKMANPAILKVIDFGVEHKRSYCTSIHRIEVILEGFTQNLEQYLAIKKSNAILLSSESLERLFLDVGAALDLYKRFDKTHKEVSPRHIAVELVGDEILTAKLIPLVGIMDSLYDITKRNMISSSEMYVAPELYDKANLVFKNEINSPIDEFKVDGFCFGLTTLKAAALGDIRKLYAQKIFNRAALGELIEDFKQFYSDTEEDVKLYEAVVGLLAVNPKERLTASKAIAIIEPDVNSVDSEAGQKDKAQKPEPHIISAAGTRVNNLSSTHVRLETRPLVNEGSQQSKFFSNTMPQARAAVQEAQRIQSPILKHYNDGGLSPNQMVGHTKAINQGIQPAAGDTLPARVREQANIDNFVVREIHSAGTHSSTFGSPPASRSLSPVDRRMNTTMALDNRPQKINFLENTTGSNANLTRNYQISNPSTAELLPLTRTEPNIGAKRYAPLVVGDVTAIEPLMFPSRSRAILKNIKVPHTNEGVIKQTELQTTNSISEPIQKLHQQAFRHNQPPAVQDLAFPVASRSVSPIPATQVHSSRQDLDHFRHYSKEIIDQERKQPQMLQTHHYPTLQQTEPNPTATHNHQKEQTIEIQLSNRNNCYKEYRRPDVVSLNMPVPLTEPLPVSSQLDAFSSNQNSGGVVNIRTQEQRQRTFLKELEGPLAKSEAVPPTITLDLTSQIMNTVTSSGVLKVGAERYARPSQSLRGLHRRSRTFDSEDRYWGGWVPFPECLERAVKGDVNYSSRPIDEHFKPFATLPIELKEASMLAPQVPKFTPEIKQALEKITGTQFRSLTPPPTRSSRYNTQPEFDNGIFKQRDPPHEIGILLNSRTPNGTTGLQMNSLEAKKQVDTKSQVDGLSGASMNEYYGDPSRLSKMRRSPNEGLDTRTSYLHRKIAKDFNEEVTTIRSRSGSATKREARRSHQVMYDSANNQNQAVTPTPSSEAGQEHNYLSYGSVGSIAGINGVFSSHQTGNLHHGSRFDSVDAIKQISAIEQSDKIAGNYTTRGDLASGGLSSDQKDSIPSDVKNNSNSQAIERWTESDKPPKQDSTNKIETSQPQPTDFRKKITKNDLSAQPVPSISASQPRFNRSVIDISASIRREGPGTPPNGHFAAALTVIMSNQPSREASPGISMSKKVSSDSNARIKAFEKNDNIQDELKNPISTKPDVLQNHQDSQQPSQHLIQYSSLLQDSQQNRSPQLPDAMGLVPLLDIRATGVIFRTEGQSRRTDLDNNSLHNGGETEAGSFADFPKPDWVTNANTPSPYQAQDSGNGSHRQSNTQQPLQTPKFNHAQSQHHQFNSQATYSYQQPSGEVLGTTFGPPVYQNHQGSYSNGQQPIANFFVPPVNNQSLSNSMFMQNGSNAASGQVPPPGSYPMFAHPVSRDYNDPSNTWMQPPSFTNPGYYPYQQQNHSFSGAASGLSSRQEPVPESSNMSSQYKPLKPPSSSNTTTARALTPPMSVTRRSPSPLTYRPILSKHKTNLSIDTSAQGSAAQLYRVESGFGNSGGANKAPKAGTLGAQLGSGSGTYRGGPTQPMGNMSLPWTTGGRDLIHQRYSPQRADLTQVKKDSHELCVSRDVSIREMSYNVDWQKGDHSNLSKEREGIDPLGMPSPLNPATNAQTSLYIDQHSVPQASLGRPNDGSAERLANMGSFEVANSSRDRDMESMSYQSSTSQLPNSSRNPAIQGAQSLLQQKNFRHLKQSQISAESIRRNIGPHSHRPPLVPPLLIPEEPQEIYESADSRNQNLKRSRKDDQGRIQKSGNSERTSEKTQQILPSAGHQGEYYTTQTGMPTTTVGLAQISEMDYGSRGYDSKHSGGSRDAVAMTGILQSKKLSSIQSRGSSKPTQLIDQIHAKLASISSNPFDSVPREPEYVSKDSKESDPEIKRIRTELSKRVIKYGRMDHDPNQDYSGSLILTQAAATFKALSNRSSASSQTTSIKEEELGDPPSSLRDPNRIETALVFPEMSVGNNSPDKNPLQSFMSKEVSPNKLASVKEMSSAKIFNLKLTSDQFAKPDKKPVIAYQTQKAADKPLPATEPLKKISMATVKVSLTKNASEWNGRNTSEEARAPQTKTEESRSEFSEFVHRRETRQYEAPQPTVDIPEIRLQMVKELGARVGTPKPTATFNPPQILQKQKTLEVKSPRDDLVIEKAQPVPSRQRTMEVIPKEPSQRDVPDIQYVENKIQFQKSPSIQHRKESGISQDKSVGRPKEPLILISVHSSKEDREKRISESSSHSVPKLGGMNEAQEIPERGLGVSGIHGMSELKLDRMPSSLSFDMDNMSPSKKSMLDIPQNPMKLTREQSIGSIGEHRMVSARSIALSSSTVNVSLSKQRDKFTRLDQNNEIEFLYSEYFEVDLEAQKK